jgi:hypothetical protein
VGGGRYEKCSSSCHASAQNTDLGGRASQREKEKRPCIEGEKGRSEDLSPRANKKIYECVTQEARNASRLSLYVCAIFFVNNFLAGF